MYFLYERERERENKQNHWIKDKDNKLNASITCLL